MCWCLLQGVEVALGYWLQVTHKDNPRFPKFSLPKNQSIILDAIILTCFTTAMLALQCGAGKRGPDLDWTAGCW